LTNSLDENDSEIVIENECNIEIKLSEFDDNKNDFLINKNPSIFLATTQHRGVLLDRIDTFNSLNNENESQNTDNYYNSDNFKISDHSNNDHDDDYDNNYYKNDNKDESMDLKKQI